MGHYLDRYASQLHQHGMGRTMDESGISPAPSSMGLDGSDLDLSSVADHSIADGMERAIVRASSQVRSGANSARSRGGVSDAPSFATDGNENSFSDFMQTLASKLDEEDETRLKLECEMFELQAKALSKYKEKQLKQLERVEQT